VDERDKDLTHLFVRDLDEIPVPPRGDWRRAPGRETSTMRASRTLLTAGAAIAVLAIALIIGSQLRDRNATVANPSASPTSSATAPVVAPSATATATPSAASSAPAAGVYNDDFGFVVTDLSTVPTINPAVTSTIRKESSSAAVGSFTHNGYWVSGDGTLIAYWTPRSPEQPLQQLRIVRAANPQSLVASSGLSANESGGFIVWANDSSAVAYVIDGPAPATTSTIRTFNIQPGSNAPGQVVFQYNEAGKSAVPIAWDRATNMLAIGVFGRGGFITDYIVADSATPGANAKRTPLNEKITSMTASSDAKFILAIDAVAGPSYWPLASIASKVTPARANDPVWRPGTHEFGWIDADKLALYSADQNATSGGFGGVPAGASIRTFRADGSAVLLAVPGGTQTTYTLVLLGKRDPSPGDRVTFQATDGVRQSVRLR
jgi:hypothetical protein